MIQARLEAGAMVASTLPSLQEQVWEWSWGMHPMWWMWGAGGLVMMLMMLLFWGLVIAGLVFAIRWLIRQGGDDRADRALEILRERYARGEITKEEFDSRRNDLTASRR
jgi:putative membrane protein